MTKKELIAEFNAQADAAQGLAKEALSRGLDYKTKRIHDEAALRGETWRQAARRLELLSEGE